MSIPLEGSDAWKAEDKGPTILVVCWTVTSVSGLFIALRLYSRACIKKIIQIDDWLVVIAQICSMISTALTSIAIRHGDGKHFSILTIEQQETTILFATVGFCPGIISFGLPKLAVVALLTRLLNPGQRHRLFLWFMGVFVNLSLLGCVGILLGQCRPASTLWDFSIKGECLDKRILVDYSMYSGILSAVADFYLAIYPAAVLLNLKMSLKKKLALTAALSIGSLSGIVAIYKTTRLPLFLSADFSYDTSDIQIWTVTEGSTILIATSIPLLQPLLEKMLRHNPFSSYRNDTKRNEAPAKDYEDRSKASQMAEYELGERKKKPKKRDDLGLTVMTVDQNSQEEILSPRRCDDDIAEEVLPDKAAEGSRHSDAGIRRTTDDNVSYTARQDGEDTMPRNWRAV